MNLSVSSNTQAILLLTAPLITGQNGVQNGELLTHGEYRRFARQLREVGHEPADLLRKEANGLLEEMAAVVPPDRVRRLLDRGFLMSQAIERWHSRAIWVISRADSYYPKSLKNRLKDDSPAVIYGCGQPKLLEGGGLAIIGSRHVDQMLIDYTETVGSQCAAAGKTVISGGAQGIDRAAMRGALEAGGRTVGVLSDSLDRAALNRENRNWLLEEQLVLVSPYDPRAGFNVGHAMQRNKIIYAFADAALVVSAEYAKGGTWAGATEQLQKLRFVPVYIRSTGDATPGLEALKKMGAQPWPNPKSSDELLAVFDLTLSIKANEQPQLSLQPTAITSGAVAATQNAEGSDATPLAEDEKQMGDPANTLIVCVRNLFADLLATPKSEAEISGKLQISRPQMKLWLQRFVEEGLIEKRTKPVRYALKQKTLV